MNLVESILDQVSGEALGKLSALANADGDATRTAIRAAVPTILASLAGTAGSKEGAGKLTTVLGKVAAQPSELTQMLDAGGGDLVEKGRAMLSSVLGDAPASTIASAIGNYAGLNLDSARRLIASLLPSILGLVAAQWRSQGGTPSALAGLLADQKENIAAALPDDFTLPDVPGLATARSAVAATGDTLRVAGDRAAGAARQTTQSALAWAAPLAAIALIAAGVWYFLRHREQPVADQQPAVAELETASRETGPVARTSLRPELPPAVDPADTAAVTNELKGVLAGTVDDMASVTDAASAAAALPKLAAFEARIDAIRGALDQMPEAGQEAVGQLVGSQSAALDEGVARLRNVPGAERLRPVVDAIATKLAGLNLAEISQQATKLFASLTQSLERVKDPATAEQALPELESASHEIDGLAKVRKSMSPGGQAMLAQLAAGARGVLEKLIGRIEEALGDRAAAIKPALDEILAKLDSLAQQPA